MGKLICLLFLVTTFLFGETLPVMLQVQGDVKLPEDFRDGVEEALTQRGYSLIDQHSQETALKEQAEQRKKPCYDDGCLLETGKMLAAQALIIAEVSKKGENRYRFKARYVDFETGTTTKTKLLYYDADIKAYKTLFKFGKVLTAGLINHRKNDSQLIKPEVKPVKKPIKKIVKKPVEKKLLESETTTKMDGRVIVTRKIPKKRVQKTEKKEIQKKNTGRFVPDRFHYGFSLTGGFHHYNYNFDLRGDEYDISLDSGTVSLGANISFFAGAQYALWVSGTFIKGFAGTADIDEPEDLESDNSGVFIDQITLLIGGRYQLESWSRDRWSYYLSGGVGVNIVSVSSDGDYDDFSFRGTGTGFHLLVEGGLSMPHKSNIFDIFLAVQLTTGFDLDDDPDESINSSSLFQVGAGVRYSF